MEHIYYAKSRLSSGKRPTCREHITKVETLAAKHGAAFGLEAAARLAGRFHDFGKYSKRFEGVLRGTHAGIDHALPGAAALIGMAGNRARAYASVIEAVNGHHAGLLDFDSLRAYCEQSVADHTPVCCNGGKETSLAGREEYAEALEAFRGDFPDTRLTKTVCSSIPHTETRLQDMLLTRMLFSCLVDADYSASAEDEQPGYLTAAEDTVFDPAQLLKKLNVYVARLRAHSSSDSGLNRIRNDLFTRCGEAGRLPCGLFTLTASTGTGKTLALLNFALRHCAVHGKRRIIMVLPFLTLAEQNADVYAQIIDSILVDHSQSELSDEARVFAERWSKPFIITTSVKFFESLFAQQPTDCRKLHNISDSVVIFDEAQSLPSELTSATLQAVHALCDAYRCTMLFSTATQPSFDALPNVTWRPTEINPQNAGMYEALRRTKVEWRMEKRVPLTDIAVEMAAETAVCAIVNMRAHARKLYRSLGTICHSDEVFFLTTDLCPNHRRRIVETIRQRLHDHMPCRVVATQCIEAGVDLDFDVMFRSLAPLDAIIQAAGRCNRNGVLNGCGRVIVFEPDEEKLYPGIRYANAAQVVRLLLSRKGIDIHDPRDIDGYYRELFKDACDSSELTDAITKKDYALTACAYQLIRKKGVRVLVPDPSSLALYDRLRSDALTVGITKRWMREAAPVTVSTFDADQLMIHGEGLHYAARNRQIVMNSDFYVLLPGHADCYLPDMGLQFRDTVPDDFCI